jgi:hypothetical protein
VIRFIKNFGGVDFHARDVVLMPDDRRNLQVERV